MSVLEALIFDVDGTLADTERDGHRVAFNRAFADAGLDWSWSPELYGDLLAVTGGKERIRRYLSRDVPDFAAPGETAEFVARLHAAKTRHYVEMLSEGSIALRPGVRRLLEDARSSGLRLAIATTTTPENVTTLLEHTLGPDATGWFDVIAAGDAVPAKKPAPDVFLLALEGLELQPANCIAFEDSRHGLDSSLGAGIPTVVTVNDYTRSQCFDGALLVVSDLGEPMQPFQVLAGESFAASHVDVALLRTLLLHARSARG